jgi:hypothetical protein
MKNNSHGMFKALQNGIVTAALAVSVFSTAAQALDLGDISYSYCGGTTTLANTTASSWWYGCVATSAGMMMAYYDTNGYNGYSYSNLIPGGTVGSTVTGTYVANTGGALFRSIVASTGHQYDYYRLSSSSYDYTSYYNTGGGTVALGYGLSGDDLTTNLHSNNCLADYMGTSQNAYGCSNGSTRYFSFTSSGERLYTSDLISLGTDYNTGNMAVGILGYIESCGYSVLDSYTQLTDTYVTSKNYSGTGFTFADFVMEIDAGRPVLLNCQSVTAGGHTMIGIGYENDGTDQIVELCDTWDGSIHTMEWDGTYSNYDFSIRSIFALELAAVPEPASLAAIFGMLALAVAAYRNKKA